MTTLNMIYQTIATTVEAHQLLTFYLFLGLINSMHEKWDGFYNFFYRFTHLMLNLPQVQAFESRHSITVEPLSQAPTAPKLSRSYEAPPLAKLTEEKSVLTSGSSGSSVVGGTP